ncbi:MAG: hypothetical protein GY856_12690 [bacterium]|nr:hypothetical protein [bacterium]
MKVVNLARRPFVNARPVVRLTVLLWIFGVLLLVANFLSYSRYWAGSAEIRGQLAAVEEEMSREEESLAQLDQQVPSLDLEEQIDQVIYLNRLIKNRTFPWSTLFEDLEEILPPEVRLFSVQPNVRFDDKMPKRQTATRSRPARSGRGSSRSSTGRTGRTTTPERSPPRRPIPAEEGPEKVGLQLPGFAKSDEALMEFVDALYASPLFQRPILRNETRDIQRGGVAFNIEVVYLTRLAGDPAASAAETDSSAIAEESAATPGVMVAADGSGAQDQPSATGTETAAGPSSQDEDQRPEVLAATPGADREDLLSRDARSADSKPEDRGAMKYPSRAKARLDAIADDSERPNGIRSGDRSPSETTRSGYRPPAQSGSGDRPAAQTGYGYRPPAQTGSGYRPPAQTGSGYRPPAPTGSGDRPAAQTRPQGRSPDESGSGYRPPTQTRPQGRSPGETGSDASRSDAPPTERDSGDNAPTRPVTPSFGKPSASGTPRLQGALPPGSRLVEEAWT